MEDAMDNKYGLGSTKVATEHHQATLKSSTKPVPVCRYCGDSHLVLCQTMKDHRCETCGEWQNDTPMGYSTGHISDH
jgi:hypothetical protein